MMFEHAYSLKFLLQAQICDAARIRSAVSDIGTDIAVTVNDAPGAPACLCVALRTQDPALVFDVCGQFGRITSVKIDEVT